MKLHSDIDFRQLVEVIGDAVIVSDPNGFITMWNPAAERIFGFSEAEAMGQSLDLIIPEGQRKRHWDGYRKTMQTGETRYASNVLKVPAIDKEGCRLSIGFTVALMYSEKKELTGIIAVVRDETARYNEERNLRERLWSLTKENDKQV